MNLPAHAFDSTRTETCEEHVANALTILRTARMWAAVVRSRLRHSRASTPGSHKRWTRYGKERYDARSMPTSR